jgi:hypothetical protein
VIIYALVACNNVHAHRARHSASKSRFTKMSTVCGGCACLRLVICTSFSFLLLRGSLSLLFGGFFCSALQFAPLRFKGSRDGSRRALLSMLESANVLAMPVKRRLWVDSCNECDCVLKKVRNVTTYQRRGRPIEALITLHRL